MANAFQDLEVWQRACQLTVATYESLTHLKDFNLKDQIQRAAVSIPSNIAEGSERGSDKDFIRFLRISKGSCAELRTQLFILKKLQQQNSIRFTGRLDPLIKEGQEISSMLEGLIKHIQSRI